MCGIAGFRGLTTTWRPTLDQVTFMLEAIEHRGKDASGIGTLKEDGGLKVYKGPITASQFTKKLKEIGHIDLGRTVLLHTRASTVGSPRENANNHPIIAGNMIMTHNGVLENYEHVYKRLGVAPLAEVDSAVIATVLSKYGAYHGMGYLQEHVRGYAAVAGLWDNDHLMLARDERPLFVVKTKDYLAWCSELSPLIELTNKEGDFKYIELLAMDDSWFMELGPDNDVVSSGPFQMKSPFRGTQQYWSRAGIFSGIGHSSNSVWEQYQLGDFTDDDPFGGTTETEPTNQGTPTGEASADGEGKGREDDDGTATNVVPLIIEKDGKTVLVDAKIGVHLRSVVGKEKAAKLDESKFRYIGPDRIHNVLTCHGDRCTRTAYISMLLKFSSPDASYFVPLCNKHLNRALTRGEFPSINSGRVALSTLG